MVVIAQIFSEFFRLPIDFYTYSVYNIYRKEVRSMSRKRKRREVNSEKLRIAALVLGIIREIIALARELID